MKINEARGDHFFDPNVTLWGHFFALAHKQFSPHAIVLEYRLIHANLHN